MHDLPQLLERHGAAVDALLAQEIPPDQQDYLSEGVWYQFSSGGKRIRPALCLMTCETLGGDPERALLFALATEVLHNFFLVHDDIEDGDTMRRDQPTLWTRVGVPNGINVGDYLIAKGYALILKSDLPPEQVLHLTRIFTTTFERTVEGQALDINLRGSPDVGLDDYYRIVQLKTAYYLAVTWVGGAAIAGVSGSQDSDSGSNGATAGVEESLWELGRCLGPAFQIRDDLLDLTVGKGRGGETGCDLKEGKPSILYAYVLDREQGSASDRRRLQEVMAKERDATSEEEVRWAIDFFRQTGALDFAESEAAALVRKADDLIESLPFSAEGRNLFRAISRYIVERKT